MNSFAAFALSLLVLMSPAQAAPTDVAPLPADVVKRLLHDPYSKPNDGSHSGSTRRQNCCVCGKLN